MAPEEKTAIRQIAFDNRIPGMYNSGRTGDREDLV